MSRLARRGRAISGTASHDPPDFLGFGLSDKPEAFGYSLFQQADMIEGLLRKLAIGGAHIVSHDMGTSVHCELLARQAEGRLGFELRTSTFLNGSMLQWMAKITPFQELLASNATLPQAIHFCRTVMPGVYVDALRGLMQSPAAITPDDARVMEELLRYQDGHLRLPALAGYMREHYIHADRWIGAWNQRRRRCNLCGPIVTPSRRPTWDVN